MIGKVNAMAYSVDWYIKDELLYARFSGKVTAQDMRECLLKEKVMMDSSPRIQIHVITDVGDVVDPLAFKDAIGVVREVGDHARVGWNLTIREKSLIVKMGAALGASIFKLRFRSFDASIRQ
jgi:hypothetical protein